MDFSQIFQCKQYEYQSGESLVFHSFQQTEGQANLSKSVDGLLNALTTELNILKLH
jgi:hypothetical protein